MAKISTPGDAEQNAARQMRTLGFPDAAVTVATGDGGVDVTSRAAIAQVKLHFKPVGRPDLQRLYGARADRHALAMIFFAYSGYSQGAVTYADSVGMALFTFSIEGSITPVNAKARQLVALSRHSGTQGRTAGKSALFKEYEARHDAIVKSYADQETKRGRKSKPKPQAEVKPKPKPKQQKAFTVEPDPSGQWEDDRPVRRSVTKAQPEGWLIRLKRGFRTT